MMVMSIYDSEPERYYDWMIWKLRKEEKENEEWKIRLSSRYAG